MVRVISSWIPGDRCRFLRALVVPLTGCIALWGCTTTVHDLAVSSVTITDSAEWFPRAVGPSKTEQTSRLLLRVDLTTGVDLSQAFSRWDTLIHADAAFCSHPDDHVLLGHSVYTSTPRADALPHPLNGPSYGESAGAAEHTYYVPLNISAPDSLAIKPRAVAFDLLAKPEDICISLRGGSTPLTMKWHYVRSNTVRISSETIREALNDAQPTNRPPCPVTGAKIVTADTGVITLNGVEVSERDLGKALFALRPTPTEVCILLPAKQNPASQFMAGFVEVLFMSRYPVSFYGDADFSHRIQLK